MDIFGVMSSQSARPQQGCKQSPFMPTTQGYCYLSHLHVQYLWFGGLAFVVRPMELADTYTVQPQGELYQVQSPGWNGQGSRRPDGAELGGFPALNPPP